MVFSKLFRHNSDYDENFSHRSWAYSGLIWPLSIHDDDQIVQTLGPGRSLNEIDRGVSRESLFHKVVELRKNLLVIQRVMLPHKLTICVAERQSPGLLSLCVAARTFRRPKSPWRSERAIPNKKLFQYLLPSQSSSRDLTELQICSGPHDKWCFLVGAQVLEAGSEKTLLLTKLKQPKW